MIDCTQNKNEYKLFHDGTSQKQRFLEPLDPAYASVDEHGIAHRMFFAQTYSEFLKYYDANNVVLGNWKPFFGNDVTIQTLEETLKKKGRHEPHYALFLSFLRLLEHARAELNTLTKKHLDFYYRDVLRLKEKGAEPSKAHVLVELAKQVPSHLIEAGELFKAGKDKLGKEVVFANNRNVVVSQAKVAALKTVYRYGGKGMNQGRIYASPVADSADGMGAKLISQDQSWHPFFNKISEKGEQTVNMPKAELGFAIASHYLFMAGGKRTITIQFATTKETKKTSILNQHHIELSNIKKSEIYRHEIFDSNTICKNDITCLLTGKEGWVDASILKFDMINSELCIELSGAAPAIVPYSPKTHGYNFQTELPVLLVKLKQQDEQIYIYDWISDLMLKQIDLTVKVKKLKTLAVSNDFGPLDTSKPFQPFGASPVAGSALVVGSKEVFQKALTEASLHVRWQNSPAPYDKKTVNVKIYYLYNGEWNDSEVAPVDIVPDIQQLTVPFIKKAISKKYVTSENSFDILGESKPYIDIKDLSALGHYSISSKHGFVRLKLDDDFGQEKYQADLLEYMQETKKTCPKGPPVGPYINELEMNYSTLQNIKLDSSTSVVFNNRQARFFHLTPFGQAEQHPFLNTTKKVSLLPRFHFFRDSTWEENESEFYIGITGLKPPQKLSLLFQVADGTADPDLEKPQQYIHWSYLRNNEWIPFSKSDIEDCTQALLNSGIITFSVPRDASDSNTLLPSGMYWLRASASSAPDAVCRLRMVAAQALEVTFADRDNDPAFSAEILPPGTINKLARPHAAIKKIIQPFETFGGCGQEASRAFYARVSERLRHKDRAVALWDYERLILEAFPQIYRVKCLNHTRFESGIYTESAPGHVTVIAIPDQQYYAQRNPLQPKVSLGLLEEVELFLKKRLSCFVRLHVINPQIEEVQVECSVRFYDGLDERFYENKLREAIIRFLSPWAFSDDSGPSFGRNIYKSVLINFVEEQSYVDYITEFKLFHYVNSKRQGGDKNEVEASQSVSILVSAESHTITSIQSAEVARPGEKCPCKA